MNNIRWKNKKPTDKFTHPNILNDPNYENALISSLRKQVQNGDFVGIIGGGRGISTVAAAEETGNSGKVAVYEASFEKIGWTTRTIELNQVSDIVEVHHALVGPDVAVWGEIGNAKEIHPSQLPDFDVLEVDCEGAEFQILDNLTYCPRVIIVEVHPHKGVKKPEIIDILENKNYTITNVGWESEDLKNPLPILTAVHCSRE